MRTEDRSTGVRIEAVGEIWVRTFVRRHCASLLVEDDESCAQSYSGLWFQLPHHPLSGHMPLHSNGRDLGAGDGADDVVCKSHVS
jgi:hypothetical protein